MVLRGLTFSVLVYSESGGFSSAVSLDCGAGFELVYLECLSYTLKLTCILSQDKLTWLTKQQKVQTPLSATTVRLQRR